MNIFKRLFVLMLTTVLLGACTTTHEKDGDEANVDGSESVDINRLEDSHTVAYPDAASLAAAEIEGIDSEGNAIGGVFDDPRSPLSKQTIYFEYDSSQLQPEFKPVVYAHAGYLAAHPEQRMVLQGHADERGSREYNIALGEQRSKSVARIMQMHGVTSRQLEIVSYGEEKPSVFGHDKAAWQKNRRVEIIYIGQ